MRRSGPPAAGYEVDAAARSDARSTVASRVNYTLAATAVAVAIVLASQNVSSGDDLKRPEVSVGLTSPDAAWGRTIGTEDVPPKRPRSVPTDASATDEAATPTVIDEPLPPPTDLIAAPPVAVPSTVSVNGIPDAALTAYKSAAAGAPAGCGLSWTLLAAIGRVESNHGRYGGATLYADGTSAPRVLGVALTGSGTALIKDTDGGLLDGDAAYDRAIGPMQFIPSTWKGYAVDGNGDGVKDPFNIFDASAAAATYLCKNGGDLTTVQGRTAAVYAYNHSASYVSTVLALADAFAAAEGSATLGVVTAPPATSTPTPTPTTPVPTPEPTPTPNPSPTPTTPTPTTPTPSTAPPSSETTTPPSSSESSPSPPSSSSSSSVLPTTDSTSSKAAATAEPRPRRNQL